MIIPKKFILTEDVLRSILFEKGETFYFDSIRSSTDCSLLVYSSKIRSYVMALNLVTISAYIKEGKIIILDIIEF